VFNIACPDEPARRPLLYRVGGGSGRGAFSVDTTPHGGPVLRTTIELDREVCDTYRVLVQAVDQSQRTADTEVVVMVTDVNDNAPSFPEFPPTTVPEGTFVAIDSLWIPEWVPNGHQRCSCCSWCWCCCYQICDLLRLFHFITDRCQTLHTHLWQRYPQSHRDVFSS